MSAATAEPNLRTFAGFRVLALRDPKTARIIRLLIGLVLFGTGLALGIEAALGVNPWTVFHQGASDRLGISVGTMVIITGLILVLLSRPLREPIGLGTVLNVAIIGPVLDLVLWLIPDLTSDLARGLALAAAPAVIGLGSGFYIGAGLGPGPRDGLMTALERRGLKVWMARTLIELTALCVGWLLGGNAGFGTIWFALSIGWFVAIFLPRLRIDPPPTDAPA